MEVPENEYKWDTYELQDNVYLWREGRKWYY
jgi:hypothetical protein